jgi:hypothetical protein
LVSGFGGFGSVGALVAAGRGAWSPLGSWRHSDLPLGLIVGLEVGFGVAEVVVLIGEGLD